MNVDEELQLIHIRRISLSLSLSSIVFDYLCRVLALAFVLERVDRREAQVGSALARQAASRHSEGLPEQPHRHYYITTTIIIIIISSSSSSRSRSRSRIVAVRGQQSGHEGQDAAHRLPAPVGQGVAPRSRHGRALQGHSVGEQRWRATGQAIRLHSSATLHQSRPLDTERARSRGLLGQLHCRAEPAPARQHLRQQRVHHWRVSRLLERYASRLFFRQHSLFDNTVFSNIYMFFVDVFANFNS